MELVVRFQINCSSVQLWTSRTSSARASVVSVAAAVTGSLGELMSASGGCRGRAVREGWSGTSGVLLRLDDHDGGSFSMEPARRQGLLGGTWDLCHVTSLELCVDAQHDLLEHIGSSLPRLVELRVINSKIASVRDLGLNSPNLERLWMSGCGLQDLEGISSFPFLKELHVAFNRLSDLFNVSFLQKLQLLDLEGNDVDDLVHVQCLRVCVKLQSLTLRGNPVCVRPGTTCPQVTDYSYRVAVQELLPQVCYLDNVKVEDRLTDILGVPGNEFGSSNEGGEVGGASHYHSPGGPSPSSSAPAPSGGPQPPSFSGCGSSESDPAASSILLHRSNSMLFCGNPVKAVRASRQRLGSAPTRSTHSLAVHQPGDTLDSADVLSELRAWRAQHSRRLQAIQKKGSPLNLRHKEEGEKDCTIQNADGAHSSVQCPPPDGLQCDTSPAPKGGVAGVRLRCLRPIETTSEHFPPINRVVQTIAGPQYVHRPHPPPTRRVNSGRTLDLSTVQSNNIFRRPATTRPHTALVLLQTPPQQHQLQCCRGSLQSL